ncbi:MAG TPA: ferredoxin [Pseudonocardia sp.]
MAPRMAPRMTLRIQVDREMCCGSGRCWSAAPDFFDLDDQGIVIALRDTAPEAERDRLTRAAGQCPTGTIQLEDQ